MCILWTQINLIFLVWWKWKEFIDKFLCAHSSLAGRFHHRKHWIKLDRELNQLNQDIHSRSPSGGTESNRTRNWINRIGTVTTLRSKWRAANVRGRKGREKRRRRKRAHNKFQHKQPKQIITYKVSNYMYYSFHPLFHCQKEKKKLRRRFNLRG